MQPYRSTSQPHWVVIFVHLRPVYTWHCAVHFYTLCRSLEFKNQHWCLPRATLPFLCRTGRSTVCWCVRMALPLRFCSLATTASIDPSLLPCPPKKDSLRWTGYWHWSLASALEIWPRAVSDSTCQPTPNSCQESVSMSGGTDHCVPGLRNILKMQRISDIDGSQAATGFL